MKQVITECNHPIKIWASEIEAEAIRQAQNVANLPIIYRHVALMPDVHAGKGSTIGTVIATKGAVIPSAVGVDIGCGMAAIRLPLRTENLKDVVQLRHSIERSIPTGREGNRSVSDRCGEVLNILGLPPSLESDNKLYKNAALQLGSLGGGNHFIELCTDLDNTLRIMLHSGSRNIGKTLADKHIDKAKGILREKMEDPDLAYLTEDIPEFDAYIRDMLWCQNYALKNRQEMILRVLKDISYHFFRDQRLFSENLLTVNCHHNYCQQETHFGEKVWITRKGAVSAGAGELGIIPGSMGAKSFIVEGLGNPESFCSCSHGAGRKMSRTQARKLFTAQDLIEQTKGIECRKDRAVVDEIPSAYKDIDQVMRDQTDLVKPLYQLKQILCVKGD